MLKKKALSILCAVLMGGLALAAQEARLSGPLSGWVFDSASRSIRPIVGLPGAAYLGDPLVAELDWASAAPEGQLALAIREGKLYGIRGLNAELAVVEIAGALATPERAAWSSDGSGAVIYSGAEGRLQFLRNLLENPVAGAAVEAPGPVVALVASGECAVAGVGSERGGGVYLVCPDAPARLLAAVAQPAALALANGGRDLFVADRATGRILEIRGFRDEATVMAFAEDSTGNADPVGLAVSADQRRLFVANRAAKRVDTYDLESRALLGQIAVEWEPALLEPLALRSVFLLKSSGSGQEPLLVLDAGREPAVYFVPAGRGE